MSRTLVLLSFGYSPYDTCRQNSAAEWH